MSELRVAPINQDHVDVSFSHELLTVFEERNLKPSIQELYSVVSVKHGERNNGYVVAQVEYLTEPFESADIVEDRTHAHLCACDGFHFHCYNQDLGVKDGDCKHIQRVKQKYEHNDADQRELVE